MTEPLFFECPHCKDGIIVHKNEINCAIFRHGYFFVNKGNEIVLTAQVPPHAPKAMCDELVEKKKILGCGKPFRIVKKNETYDIEICDYV